MLLYLRCPVPLFLDFSGRFDACVFGFFHAEEVSAYRLGDTW